MGKSSEMDTQWKVSENTEKEHTIKNSCAILMFECVFDCSNKNLVLRSPIEAPLSFFHEIASSRMNNFIGTLQEGDLEWQEKN